MAQGRHDNAVTPKFLMLAVKNEKASDEQGRAVFDNVEHVLIYMAGDRNSRPCYVVTAEHRKRWPEHYAAFKAGQEMAASGTPLEKWPMMTVARVEELKTLGIFTVENLVDVPDGNLGNLGPNSRKEREQAKAWLDNAKGSADVTQMASTIENLKAQIERLENRLQNGEGDAKPRRKPRAQKAA